MLESYLLLLKEATVFAKAKFTEEFCQVSLHWSFKLLVNGGSIQMVAAAPKAKVTYCKRTTSQHGQEQSQWFKGITVDNNA